MKSAAWVHSDGSPSTGGVLEDKSKWTTPTRIPWDDALLAFLEGYAEGLSELKSIQALPRRGRRVPNRTRRQEAARVPFKPSHVGRRLRIRLAHRFNEAFR